MAKRAPRVEKHPDDMTPEELRADVAKLEIRLEEMRSENENLEKQVDYLQGEINELNEQIEGSSEEFLRDQLDTLAIDLDPSTLTRQQFARLCSGILRGEDWRHGTWR